MVKIIKSKGFVAGVVALVIVIGGGIASAINNDPGSDGDPLVTVSYVEKKLDQLQTYIDTKILNADRKTSANDKAIAELNAKIQELDNRLRQGGANPGTGQAAEGFKVVNVEAGKKLVGYEGTELVLRFGSATAIAFPNAGLSNLTIGKDLQNGDTVARDNLIIIPRSDDRGIRAQTDIILLVKGRYTIE